MYTWLYRYVGAFTLTAANVLAAKATSPVTPPSGGLFGSKIDQRAYESSASFAGCNNKSTVSTAAASYISRTEYPHEFGALNFGVVVVPETVVKSPKRYRFAFHTSFT